MSIEIRDGDNRKTLGLGIDDLTAEILLDVMVEADARVVSSTPVDRGTARANWRVRLGDIEPTGALEVTSRPVSESAIARLDLKNIREGATIVNNVPYIGRLNDGYSRKAPAKFIEMAISEAISEVLR